MNGKGNDMDLYRAAGELAGLTSLVDAFYANMDTFPEARVIRKMHPDDLTDSRKKLTYFLCGVLGGPRLFIEHYGGVDLPDFQRKESGCSKRHNLNNCPKRDVLSATPFGPHSN
jgi:hemoglobin